MVSIFPNTILIGSDAHVVNLTYSIDQTSEDLESDVEGNIAFDISGALLLSKQVSMSMKMFP